MAEMTTSSMRVRIGGWFVPPLVVPIALGLMIVVIAIYRAVL